MTGEPDIRVAGCRLIPLNRRGDDRGELVAIEAERDSPFPVRRAYYVFGTRDGVARGFHGHRKLSQLAVCVAGSCRMLLDDGSIQQDVMLDRPDKALLIGPLVWHEMHDFTPGAVLLVLADDHYDEADYIRDHAEFLTIVSHSSEGVIRPTDC